VVDRELRVEVFNRFMQAHSGIAPEQAMAKPLTELFPELPEQWLWRRLRTVFELGIPAYTTWEERSYLFRFPLHLPIHYYVDLMYQNVMFVPLRTSNDTVERMGIVVYDVTESALAHKELEKTRAELLVLSRTDALTKLWNRGYWEERFEEEWHRARRSGGPTSVVMFDIDHFKRINDSYGHQTGDAAIRMVAATVRELSRDIDISGRYGGEEFVVILPDTGKEGALAYCERLRLAIASRSIVGPNKEVVQFTISLGVAEFDINGDNSRQWLQRADEVLYRAKDNGRNQTQIY
jgi:diguanylate cyclase (GGDEF)-like protein